MTPALPCPFCGGSVESTPDEIGSGGQHVPPYLVGCDTCRMYVVRPAEADAIAAWNRRPDVESLRESLRQSLARKHRQYVLKSIEAGRLRQQLSALVGRASGWQFVPKEPTREMLDAAAEAPDDDDWISAMAKAYAAMLAAAPPAQAPQPVAKEIRAIVDRQAEDDGLWFQAQTAPEAYLQAALRVLHAAIEAAPPAQIAEQADARDAELRRERDEALQALADLSFECYGVFCTTAPTVETYDRTFDVLQRLREKAKT